MSHCLSRVLALACALSALALLAPSARAQVGLRLEAPTFPAPVGSTGSFDVVLRNTNAVGGASYDVSEYSIRLSIDPSDGVTFTGISVNTTSAPYLFTDPNSAHGGTLTNDTFPTTSVGLDDYTFQSSGFRTLNPGDVFGLTHVFYAVDANTGLGDKTLQFSGESTLFFANGDSSGVPQQPGVITVTPAAVPEPSTCALLLSACLTGVGFLARRRQPSAR